MLGGPFPWFALGVAVAVGLLQAYRHITLVPGFGWWIHHLVGGPIPPFLDMVSSRALRAGTRLEKHGENSHVGTVQSIHVHAFENQWVRYPSNSLS